MTTTTYAVTSSRDATVTYTVTVTEDGEGMRLAACTCPDYMHRVLRGFKDSCKHMRGVL